MFDVLPGAAGSSRVPAKESAMKTLHVTGPMLLAMTAVLGGGQECRAQCCLSDLFAGCGTCFRKAPTYAVAPVAAPVVAPIAAPPPPVMVPVQQTSYVPETTYRTQMQTVPVTSYKPSCEIDPCTGCPVECMQPVTQYVQRPVSVPVTQYRAVTTTRYVQMQPGYAAPTGAVAAPAYPMAPAAPIAAPVAPAASPFAGTIQTTPQAWGAAGNDVPQQLIPSQPGVAAPALPPGTYQQPTYQPITPQSGVTMQAAPQASPLQPTTPPALAPAPSLRPIPEMPRSGAAASAPNGTPSAGATTVPPALDTQGAARGLPYGSGTYSPAPVAPSGSGTGTAAPAVMPTVPGTGPTSATGAFPRLLAPTGHTTSWQPVPQPTFVPQPPVVPQRGFSTGYPTAVLPTRLTQ